MKTLAAAVLSAGLVTGCGEAPPLMSPALHAVEPARADAPKPAAVSSAHHEDTKFNRDIAQMLDRVGRIRSLPPKEGVRGERLDREHVIRLIMAKTEDELPSGVMEAQGEMLRGLGLIDVDYEFVAGIYDMIQQNLAGFYDQHTNEMYILDDLAPESVEETLAHELVHALQDQYFDLAPLLKYRPGDSDGVTAGHALAEGDAMSAMFDLSMGDARNISVSQLRLAMVASVAFSASGNRTPRVLQASLIAPYVDGFRFVQALRESGEWDAVNAAYRRLPASTEQLLHVDKYVANEPPVVLAEPPLPTDFVRQDQDVLGEQGLRMTLEQWGTNDAAALAAAGWGGDRFAIGQHAVEGGKEWAAAWVIRFDSSADADEAEAFMAKRHPSPCAERADLGPFAWGRRSSELAIVAGPFRKAADGSVLAASTCSAAKKWLAEALSHAPPTVKTPSAGRKTPSPKTPSPKTPPAGVTPPMGKAPASNKTKTPTASGNTSKEPR